MNSLICPNCGANLLEDAWDNIRELKDGDIEVDPYPAYVCENKCGYVKRIEIQPKIIAQQGKDRLLVLYPDNQGRILDVQNSVIWPPMHCRGYWEEYIGNYNLEMLLRKARDSEMPYIESPNLFKFATSELSQDAFLCWLFEHVRLKTNDAAFQVAESILNKIFEKFKVRNPKFIKRHVLDYTLKIEQQTYNIDILLTLEPNYVSDEKIYIIIEDKIHSGESRENQPEYYAGKLKVRDSTAVIIPVLFKSGYMTLEEQKKFEERKIILIEYEDIYGLLSNYSEDIENNVILHSWWLNFNERFYKPIKSAKSLIINSMITLKDFNKEVRESLYPEIISFQKVTEYLFDFIEEGIKTKTYSVQGKGHIDWHFELSKPNWLSSKKNIALSLYFIWDTYDFSLVIKTSPLNYKPLKELTEKEKKEYEETRKTIKEEIRILKNIDWKITNYYLQIAQMNNIQNVSMDNLRKKIEREINLIINEIDRIID